MKRYVAAAFAFVATVAGAIPFVHKAVHVNARVAAGQCTLAGVHEARENPNRVLFISCGGFL